MLKQRLIALILLTFVIGNGCSKNDSTHATAAGEENNASSAPVAKDEKVTMGDDPNAKFTASQTSINSFESSNTYNDYGFAYHYERRSGDGQEHFYKSIQEFTKNDLTNQRNLLAETWVEITQQEWLETKQHYDQTRELVDLNPKILQSTPIYQKLLQFLDEQNTRQAQFEKQRADFDAEFKRRSEEFDKRWNESSQSSSRSHEAEITQPELSDNQQEVESDQSSDDSQKQESSAF
ncbi:hypothetical protein [Acinetobacter ursingii]|uniref:hypothetical protein n=1 Tax=Acinetobacter ursingii TaxID=108980 RepID=UPI000666ED85|nr:hypothetical protein [Acinetobacter ursingii]MCH2003902.1 hypothetical protein [Acinetobacter ursingii]MCU4380630.1 hypothetical protein [Acinetobacter ursingii]MCU4482575.1 hypothetical protein [Acinetobacter ursingii]MCU4506984.1 hypothetical protein [Acinetobacter ursingii]MCU4610064.1 hypothetical protein [Acinetobacter ursingii]